MFALLWFQEYSGIRPTTRTIISVRIQDFWLALWGLFVRVVASRARVFRWFIFFRSHSNQSEVICEILQE